MEEHTIAEGMTKEQADAAVKDHQAAGAIVEIRPDDYGTFRVIARKPVAVSPTLQDDLTKALQSLEIPPPDSDALDILMYAARLTPDDAQPPISTTRLFAGAVAIGQASTRTNSFVAALATVIKNDPGLSERYEGMRALFQNEADDEAVRRLRPRWFSENAAQILKLAASERTDALLGDAIVHALFKSRHGLLYGRIEMDRVASAIEALLQSSDRKLTVMDEVDVALKALEIDPVIESVRSVLFRATAYCETGEELRLRHVVLALLDGEPGVQRQLTAPSAMLLDASTFKAIPRKPAPPLDQPADPSYPLHLAPALESVLRRGFRTQRRIFLNPALGTKGLVAGILTTPPEEEPEVADSSVEFEEMLARFRELVRERLADKPDQMQEWNRALELEAANLPKLNNDQPGFGPPRDKLGITTDALAIANVAAGQSTNLPLAFGIFGDWGAGKTFFMRLIQDQIAGFVKSSAEDDGFEHAIVQIQFNAWHYAETNLWASLVGHIFDELDRWMTREESAGDPKTADQILQRLATSRQLTLEAATELVQRRKEHAKAGAALAKAQEELAKAQEAAASAPGTVWRAAVDTAQREIMNDAELKQQLGAVQAAVGVPTLLEDKAKLRAALDELNRSATAGNAALGALRSTIGGYGTVALALFALFIVPLLLYGLQSMLAAAGGWSGLAEIGRGFEALGGLLAMLAVLVGKFSAKVESLAGKFANLKKSIDAEIARATQAEQAEAAKAASEVAKSTAEVEKAKTLVQATADQVVAALKEYAEETGALRIRRFVRARAGAEGYGKHLGLVSTIRKDFEQLEAMMLNKSKEPPEHLEQARKHYEARVNALIEDAEDQLNKDEKAQLLKTAESLQKFEVPKNMEFHRIVLYIDDLDRCEPDKVVEVLQAVNMLLSFRLFVVMVAVDARWLSRSLETRYPDFFGVFDGEDGENTKRKDRWTAKGNDADRRRKNDDGRERATAADYLEKIFQIPYWVPPMTPKTSVTLVGDLIAADRIAEQPQPPSSAQHPPEEQNSKKPLPLKEEDDQRRSLEPPSRALGLTEDEIKTLKALSPFLGGSPRRARRFVNVYRVAKASLTPGEIRKLEDGEHRALATQLAIATGAPNAFGAWVTVCENAHDDLIAPRLDDVVADDVERGNIEGALETFRKMPGEGRDVSNKLAAQAARASRFSFVVPRKAPART